MWLVLLLLMLLLRNIPLGEFEVTMYNVLDCQKCMRRRKRWIWASSLCFFLLFLHRFFLCFSVLKKRRCVIQRLFSLFFSILLRCEVNEGWRVILSCFPLYFNSRLETGYLKWCFCCWRRQMKDRLSTALHVVLGCREVILFCFVVQVTC